MKFVKELPPKTGGPGRKPGTVPIKYTDEAGKLRSRPGVWAIVKTYEKHGPASAFANEVKKGKYVAFRPAGSYETATRKRGEKTNVYVRYVGK